MKAAGLSFFVLTASVSVASSIATAQQVNCERHRDPNWRAQCYRQNEWYLQEQQRIQQDIQNRQYIWGTAGGTAGAYYPPAAVGVGTGLMLDYFLNR